MTGIAYSMFAGQPLTILGSTGPVLVFEKILFKFCKYVLHQPLGDILYHHRYDICFANQLCIPCPPLVSSLTSGTTTCPICR